MSDDSESMVLLDAMFSLYTESSIESSNSMILGEYNSKDDTEQLLKIIELGEIVELGNNPLTVKGYSHEIVHLKTVSNTKQFMIGDLGFSSTPNSSNPNKSELIIVQTDSQSSSNNQVTPQSKNAIGLYLISQLCEMSGSQKQFEKAVAKATSKAEAEAEAEAEAKKQKTIVLTPQLYRQRNDVRAEKKQNKKKAIDAIKSTRISEFRGELISMQSMSSASTSFNYDIMSTLEPSTLESYTSPIEQLSTLNTYNPVSLDQIVSVASVYSKKCKQLASGSTEWTYTYGSESKSFNFKPIIGSINPNDIDNALGICAVSISTFVSQAKDAGWELPPELKKLHAIIQKYIKCFFFVTVFTKPDPLVLYSDKDIPSIWITKAELKPDESYSDFTLNIPPDDKIIDYLDYEPLFCRKENNEWDRWSLSNFVDTSGPVGQPNTSDGQYQYVTALHNGPQKVWGVYGYVYKLNSTWINNSQEILGKVEFYNKNIMTIEKSEFEYFVKTRNMFTLTKIIVDLWISVFEKATISNKSAVNPNLIFSATRNGKFVIRGINRKNINPRTNGDTSEPFMEYTRQLFNRINFRKSTDGVNGILPFQYDETYMVLSSLLLTITRVLRLFRCQIRISAMA